MPSFFLVAGQTNGYVIGVKRIPHVARLYVVDIATAFRIPNNILSLNNDSFSLVACEFKILRIFAWIRMWQRPPASEKLRWQRICGTNSSECQVAEDKKL